MIAEQRAALGGGTVYPPMAGARRGGGTEPMLDIQHVSYRYPGGIHAIGDLSLSLAPGEIVSIVGPSGCGKSTFLRLICGLRDPTSGIIGRNFGKGDRHGCSMVFQEDTLLPWLRVKDNVGLYYRFNRKSDESAQKHIAELLGMVGLGQFANYYPYQLSGGMRRRVAMLTAVAPLPDMLLLDEPFSALDEPTRIEVHQDLHGLIRRLGISALLVTHDLAEAITLSDRVLILSRPPSVVVEEVHVPFGRDRDMANLRDDPRFLEAYGHVWHTLKAQIGWKRHVDVDHRDGVSR